MTDDDRPDGTDQWARVAVAEGDDPIRALRASLAAVRAEPVDGEARRRLRAVAAEHGMWDALAVLLAEAADASDDDVVTAALLEELADVHENLDNQPAAIDALERLVDVTPDDPLVHDRLARLYHRAGAWDSAALAFERVAHLARDDRGRAALRAAARLYRDHGETERAAAVYRAIVARRPSDLEAWRALDELLAALGRWKDVAQVRGELAARTKSDVERAALLRSQARALGHAGDAAGAATLVAESAGLAPEAISSVIDYADILASGGKGHEAAALLAERIADAVGLGAPAQEVAALRLRRAVVLDESGDRDEAGKLLAVLLADAPGYVPALERVAARAAGQGDPRAHAEALLRYGEAVTDAELRAVVLAEAGRRFVDAGARSEAVRALDAALALAPDDAELRRDRAALGAQIAVERAVAAAGAGDREAAERALREVVAARPDDADAALALARVLADRGALADCAEHLRATLARIPDSVAAEQRARLVHRYASAVAGLGDADAAHQLLYEAHRLDRRSLPITLALGKSCFARKLFREAGIHLGGLAEHADAPRYATEVAAGLVMAAEADVRGLRPAAAEARYAAAARLDANCGGAWHGLAQIATERNDLEGAALYLEREGEAATTPAERLRIFDALGDLVLDVLHDPARAERCWVRVDVDHEAVLTKLLALQRKRGAGAERGETCYRLAGLRGDARARKELIEEAAEAFSTAGEHARARACADVLARSYPGDRDAIACASGVALAAGDHAIAAEWLGRALAEWDAAGDRGDGDPRRAELWRRLGEARRGRGDTGGARPAFERAIRTAPESDAAHGARRALVELAGGSAGTVTANLAELVAVEARPTDVLAWARASARSGGAGARPLFELARVLGAELSTSDRAMMAALPSRIMASDETYGAAIDPAERRALVDDPADDPLAGVLEALAEAATLVWPGTAAALAGAGLAAAERISSASHAAAAALFPPIARALGAPTVVVYASPAPEPDVAVLASAPPIVVLGRKLVGIRAQTRGDAIANGEAPTAIDSMTRGSRLDAELRFRLGRAVELARDRRLLAAAAGVARFPMIVDAIWHAFSGSTTASDASGEVAAEAERLRGAVPLLLRQRLGELLAASSRGAFDPAGYVAACHRAADRSGLLACGNVGVAIELAGGPSAARHLVELAASPRFHAVRAAWWAAIKT